jgi:glucose/arabinose dehydrogenase
MQQVTNNFRQALQRLFTRRPERATKKTARLHLETLEDRSLLAASFFAPVEPSGTVNLQLVPLANVTAGTQEVVTFGMPFTRGSVTQAQLSQIRVLKNGVEIPAFVEQLTPWRSIDNPSIDGQSVRVARIQIGYTFTSLAPETITIQWGGPTRTQNRPNFQDPRLEWHTVTSGTFVAADNVEEPDVLPLLPKEYLSKGMLDARTQPTANAVAETRDDPAVMDGMTFNGYDEYDYAQKNFFYTIINQNPGITIDYKTQAEPWLYDRASAMYELYLRSGFGISLREAVRAADFYVDHLNTSGFFTLKAGDAKYAYNESLAYTYWLLGDNKMLAPISTVVSAHSGTASRWNPNLSFWTERNVGYKLLANDIAYEVTGNTTFKTNVQTIVNDLIYHQNGANGQLPANRVDGGLYHFGWQHDASEVDDPNVIIASSWMSALVVDPMVRAYGLTESSQIADFLIRMGNFEKAASKTDANGQFEGTTRYPDYLMRADGTSENRSDTDVQHAMDVGAVAAWATYFAELRGTPDASLRQLSNDLYATYDVGVNYWTRPGGTNFNVSPPRRYTWEYKNSTNFSWALTGSDAPGQSGSLQFSAATYSVNENQASITITVTRTNGSTGAVSVNYATSNGTATAGSDYTSASGTLNFANGETTKTFSIAILNDTLIEGNETINLTLSNPTGGATLGSPNTAVLTIQDDDVAHPGTLQFSNATYAITENGGLATITVTRTGGSDGSVTVNYATSNGSATAGADYTAASGTLTFANGEITKTFTVAIINDSLPENPETVILTLSNPTGGATLGTPATATLTINDDDGQQSTVTFQQGVNGYTGTTDVNISTQYTQYTGGNGNTTFNGTQLGVYQTTGTGSYIMESLIRFGNLGVPTNATVSSATLTLWVETWTPGAILLGYYLAAPWSGTPGTNETQVGWLHRGTGQDWGTPGALGQGTDVVAGKSFVISGHPGNGGRLMTINLDPAVVQSWINNPSADQGVLLVNETPGVIVRVNASENATVSTRPKLTINFSSGSQQPGTLQFSNATYAVNENGGFATITVTRTNGSSGSVSVNYATTNGTATAGSDYTTSSGTLTFANGETSKTFTVAITNDTLIEGNETINLTLTNPTGGATLGSQNTSVLTIVDDDVAHPGTLQFSSATYAVNENGGLATITVTRTGGSDGSVTVNYATNNGTATAGADYTSASGTLTFANGETSKTFTVAIINDTLVEGNETVNLTLSNPTGGATLGSQNTAVLTIQDDDTAGQPGSLQFNASSYSLLENGGIITITVTRTGGTSGTVSVHYATSDGTATAGSDYTAASGTLTFADGEASKTFNVTVLDDNLVEGNESLTLTLSSPTGGATLGSPATATLTIVDNDSSGGVNLPPGFTQTAVATGLSSGTALATAPDGRIFVLEQGGAVRIIKNGSLLSTPAFTVPTIAESERGLLGITFDPNFATNHFVYVFYTVGGPSPTPAHNRVSRFTLSGDVAVPGSEAILIDLPDTTSRIHNGGALKFGSDGKLYIAVGNDNVFGNSQSLANPFGKILRINADGSIPTDNPFFNQTTGVNRAIWAYGLRNPYTFDVQPGTGLMYINDVGESSWEEVDRGVAGGNYGWPNSEGYTNNPLYQSPVYAYAHGTGPDQGFAIVGAAFYNPATVTFPPQYVGKYFFMDYVNGWIDYIDPAAANPKTPTNFASNIPTRYDGGPVDLEVGIDGALYYLNRLGGGVFKIQYQQATGSFTNVTTASGVGAIINQKYQETPDWWLSGQHLIDVDNDGDLDLYLSNHGGGSVVALNNGNGVFTRVTNGSIPDTEIHQMYDINEDGKVDVSMTYQDGGGRWWINNSTPGTVNFTATNVTRGTNTSRSQVMIDFNRDGKVDWLRSAPPGLVVDFGNGSGGFTEGSLSFTIPGTTSNENASFLPADFDGDDDIDLLILTGGGYDGTVGKTAYWRNNGNLTFTDVTATSGIPTNGTIARGIGDFDQDGDTDFIALENKSMPPVIYLNSGQGVFTKKTGAISGVGSGTLDYSAWGTAVTTDFDNDGVVDIIMNGKYFLKVLRGTGGGNFTSMNAAWGIKDTAASAVDDGLCFGDIDRDGDMDIIGYNEIYPTRTLNVYRNDLAPQNWINVRPVGLAGNKGAAGVKISIYAAGTNQLLWYEQVATYDFQVATSYYGYGETERHYGLGNRTNVDVSVEFYGSGHVTRLNNVAADQTIRVLESNGGAAAMLGQAPADAVWASYGTKAKLSNDELKLMGQAAIDRWAAAGVDRRQFAGVRFVQADLPDGMLGRQSGKRIEIDYNAAGKEWFVDSTPRNDSEFAGKTRPAGVDLLSVMTHELGHVLGLDHDAPGMSATVAPGIRTLPQPGKVHGKQN